MILPFDYIGYKRLSENKRFPNHRWYSDATWGENGWMVSIDQCDVALPSSWKITEEAFISPFFNVPYFKPRDSYVYNFCKCKKKRKTTFHHLFLIALCLELVLTKPSGKRLPTLFYSKIGLGTFCSLKMKIILFSDFAFFSICPFQILNSLKTTFW